MKLSTLRLQQTNTTVSSDESAIFSRSFIPAEKRKTPNSTTASIPHAKLGRPSFLAGSL